MIIRNTSVFEYSKYKQRIVPLDAEDKKPFFKS